MNNSELHWLYIYIYIYTYKCKYWLYIYVYVYIYIYRHTHIYIYIWCEAFSYRVKHRKHLASAFVLEVFESKRCDDFSVDIKFLSADQNILWLRIFWQLHFGLVLLKLLEHIINLMCFFFIRCFFLKKIATNFTYVEQCAKLVKNKSEHFFYFFLFDEECFAPLCDPPQSATNINIYIYIYTH